MHSTLAPRSSLAKRALPEFNCNTSPLQYLHQLGLRQILPQLASKVTVPICVAALNPLNTLRKLKC